MGVNYILKRMSERLCFYTFIFITSYAVLKVTSTCFKALKYTIEGFCLFFSLVCLFSAVAKRSFYSSIKKAGYIPFIPCQSRNSQRSYIYMNAMLSHFSRSHSMRDLLDGKSTQPPLSPDPPCGKHRRVGCHFLLQRRKEN